tara:strand:+ start:6640 stop:7551 length:912 start_codon:yes stop_codon:yes gene_type:complete
MTKLIKPLLASKADYGKIKYPVLATPKLDGIRCLCVNGRAYSRSMKPIPNNYIRKQLEGLHGLDGELMVNGDFNEVQSGIMSVEGEPDFTYHVFDVFGDRLGCDSGHGEPLPYKHRILNLEDWYAFDVSEELQDKINLVLPIPINNEEKLDQFLEDCLKTGYEGAMIRDPNGKYKHGRSTVNEGILLKIKKFFDAEGTLVEVTEKMTNTNDLERNELGGAKRSQCKDGLVPAGTSGSVVLKWNGLTFKVGFGPGWTDSKKQSLWAGRELFKGDLVKFSYQELSKDGVPRFGKMLSIRHPDDLS